MSYERVHSKLGILLCMYVVCIMYCVLCHVVVLVLQQLSTIYLLPIIYNIYNLIPSLVSILDSCDIILLLHAGFII
jgi:hypothetical protein